MLYIRRWSAGSKVQNQTSPEHFIDRIPLRHVAANGHLTDAEEAFLLNILVTNRQLDGTTPPGLPQAIRDREPAMWNGVVDSLRIKRMARSGEPFRLIATVDLRSVLGTGFPDGSYFGLQQEVDVDGIETPLGSAPDTLTTEQGSTKNKKYYFVDPDFECRLFSFVSAELGGLDIGDPGAEESQWTLRELQDSGVCHVDANSHAPFIAAIRIPASHKRFWFDTMPPTHEVTRVLTTTKRSRRLRPLRRLTSTRERSLQR